MLEDRVTARTDAGQDCLAGSPNCIPSTADTLAKVGTFPRAECTAGTLCPRADHSELCAGPGGPSWVVWLPAAGTAWCAGLLCRECRAELLGCQAGCAHAWVRVFLPGSGWIEFDPTNGIIGNRGLIRVAVARDPAQALPLTGTWAGVRGSQIDMAVDVRIEHVGLETRHPRFPVKEPQTC